LGKKFKIPAIISIHTEPDEQRRFDKRPLLFLRKIFEDYSIKNADYVLCVSEYVARYAKKRKAKRIEILHNKVSIAAFCNCNTGKIFRRKTILSVGRLEKPKRQDYLIKAMQNIDMDLVLIGDGSLLHRLKKLAEDMGVQEKIFFIRSVAHEEIHRYYLCCEFFAIATDFEGFCIPVIEAMAAGKPIVASDIPAIRELLDSAGVLVENSEVAFSEALNNLITDTETAKALAHKARERAIMFDSPLLEKKEKEIYEKFFKG
jgi:glycosyltransferase involved in cell wall biosynthesis